MYDPGRVIQITGASVSSFARLEELDENLLCVRQYIENKVI